MSDDSSGRVSQFLRINIYFIIFSSDNTSESSRDPLMCLMTGVSM